MKRIISTGDFETDPFKEGRIVKPFCAGLYDGTIFKSFWGDDCVAQFMAYIDSLDEPHLVYFHNGGRFDFYLDDFYTYFDGPVKIVNKRILQAFRGDHEFRDSYAIYPERLESYKKTDIEYWKFERPVRHKYKQEIIDYMKDDCVYLYDIVDTFRTLFKDKLTIGSAAIKELEKIQPFERATQSFDAFYRQFYFGGRTQCFEAGLLPGKWKVFDINSQYGKVMRDEKHPIGLQVDEGKRIGKNTSFAIVIAVNYGALPMRTENGLSFDIQEGIFYASRAEIEAGEDTGTLEIKKVIRTFDFKEQATFGTFVDTFFEKKAQAEKDGNALYRANYKRVVNSSYGKFAQDPSKYRDYLIWRKGDPLPGGKMVNGQWYDWIPSSAHGDVTLWEIPSETRTYYNVATAASITGHARAMLLRGLAAAQRPVYCDTDSIICEDLQGVDIHPVNIGAWKQEAQGDLLAIAGKKNYALWDSTIKTHKNPAKPKDPDPSCVKKASKGARINAKDLRAMATGEVIQWTSPVPVFKWNEETRFVKRRLRFTAKPGKVGR